MTSGEETRWPGPGGEVATEVGSAAANAETAAATLATGIAQRICAFRPEHLTQRALDGARTAIIDTLGCALAGACEPAVRVLLATPGIAEAPGPALVFGSERRTSALDAALVNGTASHALDYDDVSGAMGGHHSAPVTAPIFALGEQLQVSGRRALAAYTLGVETEVRLARAVNFHHYDKGWHPTATLGVFGAAAAAAHLLELDVARTAMALALAASLASGIKANFGTMTKPLHVGHAGRNGLLAALIASRGFEANAAALEHKQGWLRVFNGEGYYAAERALQDWGSPWEIESDDMGIKQFPCCGSTHPAIAMMLALVREERVAAEAVQSIDILAHRRRLPHTDNPDPRTPLAAKFSIQYVTARALADGAVRLSDFEAAAIMEDRVRRLLPLISVSAHPDMPEEGEKQFGAEVVVVLKDGRRLARRIDHLVCRSGDRAMSSEELFEKFEACAERSLERDQIAPLFERLETLETVDELGQATRLLEPRQPPGEAVRRAAAAASSRRLRPEGGFVP
jgi:2-methylcitrate dehydratase PrpD